MPLRAAGEAPSRAEIESHNLTHTPPAMWCEICMNSRSKSDWHTSTTKDTPVPCVQMDFHYLSGTLEETDLQAKACLLTIVDMETGYIGAVHVKAKSPDNFMIRFAANFLDKVNADKVRLRYDNEPNMKLLAVKIEQLRHPRQTIQEPIVRAEHQSVGGAERAHQTIQAGARALRLDVKSRIGIDPVPGNVLFSWMVRHASWSYNRFQPRGARGQTAYELRNDTVYKGTLAAFGEAVLVRVPIDPPGMRKKLDVQWVKGIWVGKMDESDGHIVLILAGISTGRSVRRLPPEQRVQREK